MMNAFDKKRVCLILLSFILMFFYYSSYSQRVHISADRICYRKSDSIKLLIQNPYYECGKGLEVVTIDLINERLKYIKRFFVLTENLNSEIRLGFSDLTSGVYILSAYISGQKEYNENNVSNILFFINNNDSLCENQYVLNLIPEGGRALLNFRNKFGIHLSTLNGKPVSQMVLVYNKYKQLIAKTVTDNSGWGYTDLPVLSYDSLTFITGNGIKLLSFLSNNYPGITDTGFTIRGSIVDDSIIIEMRKGENEPNTFVKLEAYISDLLIFQASGTFNKDTNIVETRFPIHGFENNFLNIVLKNR